MIQEVKRHRSIHGPRVYVPVAQNIRHLLCRRTLATGGVAVYGNYNFAEVHQQSFNGQGISFPGFNFLCFFGCEAQAPTDIVIATKVTKVSTLFTASKVIINGLPVIPSPDFAKAAKVCLSQNPKNVHAVKVRSDQSPRLLATTNETLSNPERN
jgi:hypothetical protein